MALPVVALRAGRVGKAGASKALLEPMVNEPLGPFGAINIPVQPTATPAYWGMSPSHIPYVTPQTQEVHNRLLNTFYPQREKMPNWKERGREVERKDPRYSSSDNTTRTNLGARSCVIQDVAFDKDKNLGWLKIGNQWHTYSATPEQFKRFLRSGSLGKEMNNIQHNKSMSMNKTAARIPPVFKAGGGSGVLRSGIATLFGF